ncbi:hypothetical protein MGYG_02994 [Nannizzia gypsea CBS 118893]|uniref:Uncharacterized protein n=1 Tax=Arthroderma gypseum (strain ATCC MYA-4604 / CBS 118893) TaxID=535722 RepID=E4UQ67_ARTGP|nr:hypothetical protein MGYG_02994 [Nannizzia gypsea CBS 118893]EFQ99986.1 hypothetical protein MGYG_02994 [Nannizzia gypsea CBS 118893]
MLAIDGTNVSVPEQLHLYSRLTPFLFPAGEETGIWRLPKLSTVNRLWVLPGRRPDKVDSGIFQTASVSMESNGGYGDESRLDIRDGFTLKRLRVWYFDTLIRQTIAMACRTISYDDSLGQRLDKSAVQGRSSGQWLAYVCAPRLAIWTSRMQTLLNVS